VIASGDDRAAADPLTASGLCWAYDAPLLLVSESFTPPEVTRVIDEIADDNPGVRVTVHIVGGPRSVPDARYAEIASGVGSGRVVADRLTRTGDRYDLASVIAQRVRQANGGAAPDAVLVANGADSEKFFDALALSALTSAEGYPILLVGSDSVPARTRQTLEQLSPDRVIVGGGPRTVSPAVAASLGAERWYGADRYSTATSIASRATAEGMVDPVYVGVAAVLPDALTGGSMVGAQGGPLLITDGASLSRAPSSWLGAHRGTIDTCYVFGGYRSVAPAVLSQIDVRLR
jgi:putative cell wall-binding protein